MTQPDVLLYVAAIEGLAIVAGTLLVFVQLRKQVHEMSRTHDWNRRKASQEACFEFLGPKIHDHWIAIYDSVVAGKKRHTDLTDEEKRSLREVLSFFENLGVLLKHNIVDQEIIYDFFGGLWPLIYDRASDFIAQYRIQRDNEAVFENFVEWAEHFTEVDRKLREQRKLEGRLPRKTELTG